MYIYVHARVSVICRVRVLFLVCTRVWVYTSAWCVRETDTEELGMREEETLTFLPLLTRDPNWPPKAAPLPVPRPRPGGPACSWNWALAKFVPPGSTATGRRCLRSRRLVGLLAAFRGLGKTGPRVPSPGFQGHFRSGLGPSLAEASPGEEEPGCLGLCWPEGHPAVTTSLPRWSPGAWPGWWRVPVRNRSNLPSLAAGGLPGWVLPPAL
ncbi:unnamed protein product [Rangifer tarandus platyrhynchus]|uniref:Secreted protein n=2 Tax=Rangifer tarandus platyrhynchus TaxID=3082113 RepID=A0ABN8ZHF4_RANTA|nr:unnamed protein product [Rangifer tarandus platyrhynchus]